MNFKKHKIPKLLLVQWEKHTRPNNYIDRTHTIEIKYFLVDPKAVHEMYIEYGYEDGDNVKNHRSKEFSDVDNTYWYEIRVKNLLTYNDNYNIKDLLA